MVGMEGVYAVMHYDVECDQVVAVYPTLKEATAKALNPDTDDLEQPWYEVIWLPWGTSMYKGTTIEIDRPA